MFLLVMVIKGSLLSDLHIIELLSRDGGVQAPIFIKDFAVLLGDPAKGVGFAVEGQGFLLAFGRGLFEFSFIIGNGQL